MNEIVNKYLLARNKVIPEMHLKSPCGLFIKYKERNQKFKGTGNSRYTCKNELDK